MGLLRRRRVPVEPRFVRATIKHIVAVRDLGVIPAPRMVARAADGRLITLEFATLDQAAALAWSVLDVVRRIEVRPELDGRFQR